MNKISQGKSVCSQESIDESIHAFQAGQFVIVADGADRKNECDLVFSADQATTQAMAFAIRKGSGIVYVVSNKEALQHFGFYPATTVNSDRFSIGAYVSTTFVPGSSTGLSAADRAATARALCNRSNTPDVFSKPGHMFPVASHADGVLGRPGHTEAAYDLCRLAGRMPVACLTELTNEDGTMLRWQGAVEFGQKHGIPVITVDQIMRRRQMSPQFPNAPNPDSIPSIRGLDLPAFDGSGLRIAIVGARWNSVITRSLVMGAREALESCNVRDISIEYVAGSYEIPAAAQVLLESRKFDGIICVGCLIKGQSMHFEYVSEAVTQGIMRLNLDYKVRASGRDTVVILSVGVVLRFVVAQVPVVYGILSVLSEEQARQRSGISSAHNSGRECLD